MFYLFSDGYADQFGGEKGKKYKVSKLREFLISIQGKPINEHKELLDKELMEWMKGYEQVDDVCIIGVRI
jgi:serine phosphatase RsbU (regulator of sigma subunit)